MPALTITVADVKNVIPTKMNEELIQAFIDTVDSKVAKCYSSLPDAVQRILKSHLVAYFIDVSQNGNNITSKSAPNGASISYSVDISRTGLASSAYGRIVLSLDTTGCWANLTNVSFGIRAIGR